MTDDTRSDNIHEIAIQTGFPEEVVARLYDEVLQCLGAEASINDYLHLLTCKRVRWHFKRLRRTERQNVQFNSDGRYFDTE